MELPLLLHADELEDEGAAGAFPASPLLEEDAEDEELAFDAVREQSRPAIRDSGSTPGSGGVNEGEEEERTVLLAMTPTASSARLLMMALRRRHSSAARRPKFVASSSDSRCAC